MYVYIYMYICMYIYIHTYMYNVYMYICIYLNNKYIYVVPLGALYLLASLMRSTLQIWSPKWNAIVARARTRMRPCSLRRRPRGRSRTMATMRTCARPSDAESSSQRSRSAMFFLNASDVTGRCLRWNSYESGFCIAILYMQGIFTSKHVFRLSLEVLIPKLSL